MLWESESNLGTKRKKGRFKKIKKEMREEKSEKTKTKQKKINAFRFIRNRNDDGSMDKMNDCEDYQPTCHTFS
jgi:hypothetical protein